MSSFHEMLQEFGQTIQKQWNEAEQESHHFAVTAKKVAALRVNDAWEFTQGATSYPINVFAALVQLAALQGAMGEHMYHTAHLRQAILFKILKMAWHHKEYTAEIISEYLVTHQMQLIGKVTGNALINRLLLRKLKALGITKIPVKVPGMVLSGYGAAQLGISYGLIKIEQMIPTILGGYPQFLPVFPKNRVQANPLEIKTGFLLLDGVEQLNENITAIH